MGFSKSKVDNTFWIGTLYQHQTPNV